MVGDKMGYMKIGAIAAGCWLLVVSYFVWWGGTRPAGEGDSLAYHIPIARMIGEGKWTDRDGYKLPFYYYPAMGETLLAGMMKMGLPINWYNLLGWIVFTGVIYGLARRWSLEKETAVIAAVTVAMWPSVIRLIPTQTVDIWVAVWWMAAVMKLTINNLQFTIEKQRNNLFWLGVYLGMLMGTKYSGLLFVFVLLVFFWRKLEKNIWKWLVPMMLVGGFWYVRNWMVVGNPIYPLEVSWLGWRGEPNLVLFTGRPILTLITSGGVKLMAGALVSEYLIWAGLLLTPIWIRNKWVVLGILNYFIYLILPSRAENIISDLRYTYPAFIPLILSVWKKMEKIGKGQIIKITAVLAMFVEMTQLDYHPKLFTLMILIVGLFFWKFEILNTKIQLKSKF